MSLENVMRLVQQMSVEERIEAARMVLGGRVRHLVRHEGDIKFFVHGYEYAQFPDVYEVIVNEVHVYDSDMFAAFYKAYDNNDDVKDDVLDFLNAVLNERFEASRWLTYPRWNRDAWDTF